MTTLIYNSAGNKEYSFAALGNLDTPPPMGRFHSPYAFQDFVGNIKHGLELENITVEKEEFITHHDDQRLFGAMQIRIPSVSGEYIAKNDFQFVLGLRGSHDQSIPRGMVLGNQVMVCSNLCFNGDLGSSLNTKQTLNITTRIPELVRRTLSVIPEQAEKQIQRVEAYKNTTITKRQGDAALVELLRLDAISPPQLGKAVKEWDKPTYSEHADQGLSIWRMLNACTESIKPGGANCNPVLIEQRTRKISTFLDEVVGL